MTRSTLIASVAVAALMTFAPPAFAQAQPDPHHPADQSTKPSPAPRAKAPAAKPASPASSRMTMQGGSMPMMNMMMMGMMQQGAAAASGMAMPGMDMADRVEGRISFLRTEFKIADSQATAWNDFAASLRANAKSLGDMRGMMSQKDAAAPTLPQRLEQQERWYAARLDGIRALKTTFARLYGVLNDEQKQSADQIAAPHLGLMPMGAMPMGMMSMSGPSGGGMPKGKKPGQ